MLHYNESLCIVQGLTVTSLSETSGAYHDGLRDNDVILKVGNEFVRYSRPSTVFRKLESCKSSSVTFQVERWPSAGQSFEDVSKPNVTVVSSFRC